MEFKEIFGERFRHALHFGDELLQIMLPVVEQRLADQNWRIRESALALGSREGGTNGLVQEYLPQLVGFPVPNVGRSETFGEINDVLDVVSIFRGCVDPPCRLITRTRFLNDREASAAGLQQLQTVMMGILNKIVDKNKKVQAGACGALANCLQEGREILAPWTEQIVQALSAALERYQRKNQRNLYDAVADHGGVHRSFDFRSKIRRPVASENDGEVEKRARRRSRNLSSLRVHHSSRSRYW